MRINISRIVGCSALDSDCGHTDAEQRARILIATEYSSDSMTRERPYYRRIADISLLTFLLVQFSCVNDPHIRLLPPHLFEPVEGGVNAFILAIRPLNLGTIRRPVRRDGKAP